MLDFRVCEWCGEEIEQGRSDKRFCDKRCYNYSKNLEEIKNAIKNKDSKKLLEIFSSTKKVRKEIIEAGQDTDKPGFGRN